MLVLASADRCRTGLIGRVSDVVGDVERPVFKRGDRLNLLVHDVDYGGLIVVGG